MANTAGQKSREALPAFLNNKRKTCLSLHTKRNIDMGYFVSQSFVKLWCFEVFRDCNTYYIVLYVRVKYLLKYWVDRQLISTTGYNFQKIANVWRHLYLGVGFLISLVKIIICCITSCLPRGMNIWELCLFVWRQICFLPTLRSFPSVDLRESGRLLKVRWRMGGGTHCLAA